MKTSNLHDASFSWIKTLVDSNRNSTFSYFIVRILYFHICFFYYSGPFFVYNALSYRYELTFLNMHFRNVFVYWRNKLVQSRAVIAWSEDYPVSQCRVVATIWDRRMQCSWKSLSFHIWTLLLRQFFSASWS